MLLAILREYKKKKRKESAIPNDSLVRFAIT